MVFKQSTLYLLSGTGNTFRVACWIQELLETFGTETNLQMSDHAKPRQELSQEKLLVRPKPMYLLMKKHRRYVLIDKGTSIEKKLSRIPGTYALLLELKQMASIRIGKLGVFCFEPGYYIYVGSAFGPGGLEARVGRHSSSNKKCRWHIDYLRRKCTLLEVWYSEQPQNMECRWASLITHLKTVSAPVTKFGSSDCKCTTHLFHFSEIGDEIGDVVEMLKK